MKQEMQMMVVMMTPNWMRSGHTSNKEAVDYDNYYDVYD